MTIPAGKPAGNLFPWAMAFELGVCAAAIAAAFFAGCYPWSVPDAQAQAAFQLRAVGWGLLATLPPLVVLGILDHRPQWLWLSELRDFVHAVVTPLFHKTTIWQFALLSLAAGWGEEVLFRGAIQQGAAAWIGPWGGLLLSAVLFGLAHAMTIQYALLSGAIGLYFGLVTLYLGSLIPAITAHAAYDFLALVYLVRIRPTARRDEPGQGPGDGP